MLASKKAIAISIYSAAVLYAGGHSFYSIEDRMLPGLGGAVKPNLLYNPLASFIAGSHRRRCGKPGCFRIDSMSYLDKPVPLNAGNTNTLAS